MKISSLHKAKIEINFTNNAKRSIKLQSLVDEGLKGERFTNGNVKTEK